MKSSASLIETLEQNGFKITSSHGTSIGQKAAVQAAKVPALTGKDILTDPKFPGTVKADFDKRTEGFTYMSPIPEIVKEPIGLPADMRKFEDPAIIKDMFFQVPGDHQFHDHDHGHGHGAERTRRCARPLSKGTP